MDNVTNYIKDLKDSQLIVPKFYLNIQENIKKINQDLSRIKNTSNYLKALESIDENLKDVPSDLTLDAFDKLSDEEKAKYPDFKKFLEYKIEIIDSVQLVVKDSMELINDCIGSIETTKNSLYVMHKDKTLPEGASYDVAVEKMNMLQTKIDLLSELKTKLPDVSKKDCDYRSFNVYSLVSDIENSLNNALTLESSLDLTRPPANQTVIENKPIIEKKIDYDMQANKDKKERIKDYEMLVNHLEGTEVDQSVVAEVKAILEEMKSKYSEYDKEKEANQSVKIDLQGVKKDNEIRPSISKEIEENLANLKNEQNMINSKDASISEKLALYRHMWNAKKHTVLTEESVKGTKEIEKIEDSLKNKRLIKDGKIKLTGMNLAKDRFNAIKTSILSKIKSNYNSNYANLREKLELNQLEKFISKRHGDSAYTLLLQAQEEYAIDITNKIKAKEDSLKLHENEIKNNTAKEAELLKKDNEFADFEKNLDKEVEDLQNKIDNIISTKLMEDENFNRLVNVKSNEINSNIESPELGNIEMFIQTLQNKTINELPKSLRDELLKYIKNMNNVNQKTNIKEEGKTGPETKAVDNSNEEIAPKTESLYYSEEEINL